MNALAVAIKTLQAWQVAVLATTLVVAAGGTYATYAAVTAPKSTGLTATQQLVPVQVGDLVNKVSTNGSLVFPNKETLTFSTQGKVAEVSATVGQSVAKDQVLAKLDAVSIANLETALIRARQNLQKAQDALDTARNPYTALAVAQAESKVAGAKLAASKTQTTYDTVKAGPTGNDITKARDAVTQAVTGLANAQADLETTTQDWLTKVSDAQTAWGTASTNYRDIYRTWLGITVTDAEAEAAPDTLLQKWGADLDGLFNTRGRALYQGWMADGPAANDPQTPWNESTIWVWTNLNPSEVTGTCASGTPVQVRCARLDMDNAWTAYQKSVTALKVAQTSESKALVAAQTAVSRAQDTLTNAQEALDTVLAGPDALEVDAKAKDLAVAQAALKDAQDSLAKVLKGGDPLEIAAKESDLKVTQLAVETAQTNLAGASLTAPFAGLVSAVNITVGATVGPNANAIQVVDPTVVEISGTVDEIDVLFVRNGMPAQVTMDALGGRTLTGTVASVSTAATTTGGVVTYPITITVEAPATLQLREGLSATADIVLREEKDVLLVPQQALRGTFDQPTVLVSVSGKSQARSVTLGNSDDFWVVVQSGLKEGEQVVMESAQVARTTGLGAGTFTLGGQGAFPGAGGIRGQVGPTGGGRQAGGAAGGARNNQRP